MFNFDCLCSTGIWSAGTTVSSAGERYQPPKPVGADFWHCYVSGDTPETVARIDKDRIYGLHVCDSLPFSGGIPDETVLRDLPTGSGALDLREWCDAVKSTGYVGWWSPELFCRKQHQSNSFQMAAELKSLLENLIR
ncbi:sugar phosphate isomerase/epimerase family protein [Ruegeria arenilitoris]|uniref:sugar phosphate isomerase/epimerase family protein n=1 Tax=Ruegeria arenilitoris TaxID=1173585 RepID=UPI0020C5054B|nr:TIM barrel protein [Ruegeria arenilitoris]